MASSTKLEALDKYIQNYCSPVKRNSGLLVMKHIMGLLGNPHDSLNIVHIAGTSGKTSTAYYLADMLTKSGLKVGLSVSPYVDIVTERFQFNMLPISEKMFSNKANELIDTLKKEKIRPSYFEFMTAFTYWIFAYLEVDYAVIEVGIGGTQDSTNVAQSKNKICVITDIGMDHMEILGNTIERISENKAGIIHGGNKAFMYKQNDTVNDVLLSRARTAGADLEFVEVDSFKDFATGMPDYQARNWLLAHYVYCYISNKDNLSPLDNEKLRKSTMMQVPGRMDIINYRGHKLIFDGAHNEQKMAALVNSVIKMYGDI